MKPPMYVRTLTPEERRQLTASLRSSNAFTLRRCQILLASARGQRPAQIAHHLGCATQSVRNAIRAYHARGLACLQSQSRSTWTLRLAAEVCWERGLTPYHVSIENIRQALKRLGISWRRAK